MNSALVFVGRLASGLITLLGVALMFAPILSGDLTQLAHPTVWATLVAGGVLMGLGMARLVSPEELPVLSWINVALGACILTTPWLLRFSADEDRMWTAIGTGAIVMVLAALSAKMTLVKRQRLLLRYDTRAHT